MKRLALIMISFAMIFGSFGCSSDSGDPAGPPGGGSGDLDAPSGLTLTPVSDSEILIEWTDNNEGATKFVIDRKIGAATWAELIIVPAGTVEFTDDNLNEGTDYTYRVKAKKDNVLSDASTEVMTTTPPKSPNNFQAATVSSESVTLQWNDRSEVETGYELQRRMEGEADFTELTSLSRNADDYTDSDLTQGESYVYRIRALMDDKVSVWTDEVTAMTPVAPSDLAAEVVSESEVELSWTDNTANEAGFKIEAQLVGGSWAQVGEVEPNITDFTATALTEGSRYRFQVKAFMTNGESGYSEVAEVTTFPAAPANLTATQDEEVALQVNVAWTDMSASESGFELERKSSGGEYELIKTTLPGATSYIDTDVISNSTYTYRLRAKTASAFSNWSDEATVTVVILIPPAPSDLQVESLSPTANRITWTDNSDNETGFRLERSRQMDLGYQVIATLEADVTTYDDEGLSDNTMYYYRIYSFNDNGYSDYSEVVDITTPEGAPAAPTNLHAPLVSANRANLAWTDRSDNETAFVLERSLASDAGFVELTRTAADVESYSDDTLLELTTYYYRVKAVNDVGESAFTDVLEVTTPLGVPQRPTNLEGVATIGTISLTWIDNATNEDSIFLQRMNPDRRWAPAIGFGANTTSYVDEDNIEPEETYKYRVWAINEAGFSGYSNELEIMSVGEPPAAPEELEAEVENLVDVRLRWLSVTFNETAFHIERHLEGSAVWQVIGTNDGSSYYLDEGLELETTYYYRVRGQNASGFSEYSDEIIVTTKSKTLIAEDFEEYDDGAEPEGVWTYSQGGNGFINVDSDNPHGGNLSAHYEDPEAADFAQVIANTDDIPKGELTTWMYIADSSSWFGIHLQSQAAWNGGIEIVSWFHLDTIQTNDGNAWFFAEYSWPVGEWFEFKITWDIEAGTFGLYVDQEAVFEDNGLVIGNAINHLFIVTFGDQSCPEAYFDDLLLEHVLDEEEEEAPRAIRRQAGSTLPGYNQNYPTTRFSR